MKKLIHTTASNLVKSDSFSAFPPNYRNAGLISAHFSKGQPKNGVENGPQLIKSSTLFSDFAKSGISLHDFGGVTQTHKEPDPPINGCTNAGTVIDNNLRLKAKVIESIRAAPKETAMLVLGGDHSTAIGSISGHCAARPDQEVAVIWVDAHADINAPADSLTGNMHGMPLAFLLHEMQHLIPKQFQQLKPCIKSKNLVYIGLRDLDEKERMHLEQMGIEHFTMRDVERLGIATVMRKAMDHVNPKLEKPIHLSFDVDSLDPAHAPSTGTPVPGGLTLREGKYICEEVYYTKKLSMMDLVEVNPSIGSSKDVDLTKQSATEIISASFGLARMSI